MFRFLSRIKSSSNLCRNVYRTLQNRPLAASPNILLRQPVRSYNNDENGNDSSHQYGRVWSGPLFWMSSLAFYLYLDPREHRFGTFLRTANCKSDGINNRKRIRENSVDELELFNAINRNDTVKVENLIKSGTIDVNGRHSLGWTPLHLASVQGRKDIVGMLLEAGADVDSIDEYSNAFQLAFENQLNFRSVLRIREEQFCNLLDEKASFLGTTPLHYACLMGHIDTILLLMKNNANPNIENEFGHKAIDYLDKNDPQIAKLFPEFEKYCKNYENYIQ